MAHATLSACAHPANQTNAPAKLMAALDVIEGGEGHRETSLSIEGLIIGMRATTARELLWKAQRIERAVENDWTPDATLELVRSLQADLAALAMSVAA